ncbi:MAG: ABC transporter permease, partial [Bifidobacterium sp.]|nr:ABC transporter permease [Bifidobacterium sp.]
GRRRPRAGAHAPAAHIAQPQRENHSMFVLTNAWRQLRSHPWRSLLTLVVSLLVTAGSVFGASVMHEYNTAHSTGYDALKPIAQVTPKDAKAFLKEGADSASTKNYMTWEKYNELGNSAQAQKVSFQYTVAASAPVRESKTLKAITSDDTADASEDKTGGDLTVQSFYTEQATEVNKWGTFKVVEGKAPTYTPSSMEEAEVPGVIVSKALAEKNNLKVGSKVTVGAPTDASKTLNLTVVGIYEYTANPYDMPGKDAEFAKYDRDNVIYTSYYVFSGYGLDDENNEKGWGLPDLNVVFTFDNPATYESFKKAVAKNVPSGYEVNSPTIDEYLKSLEPLDTLATTTRILLICLWAVGAALLIALVLWEVLPRTNELGYDLGIGVTRGRAGWQLMVEVFLQVVPGWLLGLLIGRCCANPLAGALGTGREIGVPGSIVWRVTWIGALGCLALALIGLVRACCLRTARVLRSPYIDNAD